MNGGYYRCKWVWLCVKVSAMRWVCVFAHGTWLTGVVLQSSWQSRVVSLGPFSEPRRRECSPRAWSSGSWSAVRPLLSLSLYLNKGTEKWPSWHITFWWGVIVMCQISFTLRSCKMLRCARWYPVEHFQIMCTARLLLPGWALSLGSAAGAGESFTCRELCSCINKCVCVCVCVSMPVGNCSTGTW